MWLRQLIWFSAVQRWHPLYNIQCFLPFTWSNRASAMRWCRGYIIWYHCVEISTAQWSVESSQTAAVHLGNHPDVCLCRGLSVFVRALDSDYKERHTGSNRRPIRAMRVRVAGIWAACQPAETPELDTNHPSFMHSEKKPAAFCFLFVVLFLLTLLLSS